MKKSIELTQQEADALIHLIDLAVKSTGLMHAEAGVVFLKRIQEVFREEKEPEINN
ncbi:MAG: hypothetical protein IT212_07535 [Bacteroidia bacterium]|nr:hypothetical protein [Bacteroidia bacterium]